MVIQMNIDIYTSIFRDILPNADNYCGEFCYLIINASNQIKIYDNNGNSLKQCVIVYQKKWRNLQNCYLWETIHKGRIGIQDGWMIINQ